MQEPILNNMAEEKVYTPEVISENALPSDDAGISYAASEGESKGTYTPATVKEQQIPTKRIAIELLSTVLNTKSKKILGELQFTEMGAIQIGKYEHGVSGEVKISQDGIVAKNKAGSTTVTIDGDTGDATFAGTLQTGSVVAGAVAIGENGDIYIDGESRRMIWYVAGIPTIVIGNG